MMKLFTLAAVCAYASAAVIELDPRVEEHQETILNNLNDCDFDLILDVRSLYYYENWGIRGAEWVQNFDLRRLYDGSIRKVAFYCWIAPWESEPASLWFDANFGHLGIETYDMKGLTYLDDIPGFCPFINGTPELIEQMGPQCANAQPHTCPAETAAPVALTEEQVAAAAAAPVSVDTPSLSELPMTAEAFREGIANALSEYYGQPVDIDLSNLPTADPAHSVSLTDETITPLVPVHRDTSHQGYYILSYGNGPAEIIIQTETVTAAEAAPPAQPTGETEAPAEAEAATARESFELLRLLVLAAAVVAVVGAAFAARMMCTRAVPEDAESPAPAGAKQAKELEPHFTTENALADVEVEATKPSVDTV